MSSQRNSSFLYLGGSLLITLALFGVLWKTYLKPLFPKKQHNDHEIVESNENNEQLIRIVGSSSMGSKLIPELAKAFLEDHGYEQVKIIGNGDEQIGEQPLFVVGNKEGKPYKIVINSENSSKGFELLSQYSCDIAMSSRPMNSGEETRFQTNGLMPIAEHVIAMDGIAIIVSGDNPIQTLTQTQVQQIFSGFINNWSQIAHNKAGTITLYGRDGNSGSYESFKQLAMQDIAISPAIKIFNTNKDLATAVSKDPNGIGYVSLREVGNNKTVSISATEKTLPFYPNNFTISTEDYPFSRRLYLYISTGQASRLITEKFVAFCISQKGEEVVAQTGFVGMNVATQPSAMVLPTSGEIPETYKTATQGAVRENFNIHFVSGSTELDNKAIDDIKRLKDSPFTLSREIRLIGFTDDIGEERKNIQLSSERARSVEKALLGIGLNNVKTTGLGEAMPIGNNQTPQGRDRNRRVEVWLKK